MPEYEHRCNNQECQYEWEQEYSIKMAPPKQCPKCQQETAQRMISLGGKGVVVLEGNELVAKCKADAQQIQREASQNENTYANLLGETRHEALQQKIDRQKRDR
jgi:putative FmdB family regulatory protein